MSGAPDLTPEPQRVAIVTGASQGIGAGLATAFRRAGSAVVGTARSIPASDDSDFLTVEGDIADVETARRVVEQALDRFGRIDTPDQQRGDLHRQAVHGIHRRRLRRDHRREPGRVLPHHPARDPADGPSGRRSRRQHHHQPRRSRRQHETGGTGFAHEGRARRRDPLAGDRVRLTRRSGQRGRPRGHPDPRARPRVLRGHGRPSSARPDRSRSATSSTGSSTSTRATFVTGEILHIDGGWAAGH